MNDTGYPYVFLHSHDSTLLTHYRGVSSTLTGGIDVFQDFGDTPERMRTNSGIDMHSFSRFGGYSFVNRRELQLVGKLNLPLHPLAARTCMRGQVEQWRARTGLCASHAYSILATEKY